MGFKVSVIISILNGSHYIERIIRCLSEQTFRDFETVFVIDEKSTDDSINMVKKFAESMENSKIVTQTGEGRLGESRNIGLENASGDLVWFLDVDDVPNWEYLNIMTKMQSDFGADVVVCNYTYSAHNKVRIKKTSYDKSNVDVMDGSEALRRRMNEKLPVQTWCKLVKRDFLLKNNIRFDKGLNEDIGFTYRIFSAAKTVCYYRKPLYSYQKNSDSVCAHNKDARGTSEIAIYDDLEGMFADDDAKLRSVLVRIRSSGHMSYKTFLKYANSKECKDMCRRNVKKFNAEIFWYLNFPRTYYLAEQIYFKLVFYRDGRNYTR